MEQLKELGIKAMEFVKSMTDDEINHALDSELEELLKYKHLKDKIINETIDRMLKSCDDMTKTPGLFNKDLITYAILNDKNAQKAYFITLKKVALPYILKKWIKNEGI